MSKIILKKNGTDYLFGFIPLHYPADRVYLDGDTSKNVQDNMARKSDLTDLLLAVYPVGSIYMSVNNVNPGTLFGGTWVAWGSGKVPVGVDANDTDFDTVEETGGTKSVTLTSAQSGVPAHSHGLNSHTHTMNHGHGFTQPTVNGGGITSGITGGSHAHEYYSPIIQKVQAINSGDTYGNYNKSYLIATSSDTHTHDLPSHTHKVSGGAVSNMSGSTGAATGNTANNTAADASQAHTNLQPYITCYMWKRTA